MNQEIFIWFDKWFDKNKNLLNQKRLQLEFSEKRHEEEIWSRSVDIESSTKFGNVIVYNVGTCDTHTASFNEDENSASARLINSEEELNKLLKNYFDDF